MTTREENELLTRTGPGTPMGRVLRSYWQPLALVAELPEERPLREIRVLGEDLVVFRDEAGRYGALRRRCAHRAGDLSFGRLEGGGLRCPYHGWLYDVQGRCLEQPAEPAGASFRGKVRQPAFPCVERNGIVYGYLGPGEPPLFPAFDWHLAPAAHTFVWKGHQRANWLQATEGEIDPSHISYLHRYLRDELDDEGSYGLDQFLAAADGTDVSITRLFRDIPNPRLEIERTGFGVRIYALRDAGSFMHVRVTNYVFPNAALVAIGGWSLVQVHVPIDDESNWRYDIFSSFDAPIDRERLTRERLNTYTVPDYRPKRNLENRYLFSAEEQRTGTFAGVGYDFNIHDTCILEGQGPIQDRTLEHLGYTDRPIIAARQMLLAAAAAPDGALPGLAREAAANRFDDLATIDTVTAPDDWRTGWIAKQIARRRASPWAGAIDPVRLGELASRR
jgi:nitrite reductase/ring-hydroxylating ferredoxin subunit